MMTLSVCMIVKNEEETLFKCLSSVAGVADEIIIIDTGSTDKTKSIAEKFTNNVYDFKWENDFSKARNFSFAKATKDYIMWLDADDKLLQDDAKKLAALKSTLPPLVDVVMMRYNTGFDASGKVIFSYYRERILRRSKGFKWKEPVHEYLEINGSVITADICITHNKPAGKKAGGRNLQIYENMLKNGNELSPRGKYYFARELKDNKRYQEAAEWFSKFLNEGGGWLEDNITACGELSKCLLAVDSADASGKALEALLHSFKYDAPRAEICCQMGYYFKAKKRYRLAIFWFEAVFSLEKKEGNWGFVQEDCWGYIPCIECAFCYDKLKSHEKAEQYNERAAVYMPDSPSVKHNREYFAEIKAKTTKTTKTSTP